MRAGGEDDTGATGDRRAAIPVRALAARARGLSLESQMSECVDLLQVPELVADEVKRSVAVVRDEAKTFDGLDGLLQDPEPPDEAFFYASRELFVRGDGCSFTCLATGVDFAPQDPQLPAAVASPADADPGSAPDDGAPPRTIDYAAVTCESRPWPVLGFVQQEESESAYPLMLRALTGTIELLRPRRFDLLDREIYRGLLGPAPAFDLALVLWDDDEALPARRPLCELTRDLAELLKSNLVADAAFPPILRDIVCLRMNNKRFDGRLRFVWRV